jgi:mannose-6-phosphate isomerase-like protein (cupin superfamily)
MIRAKKTEIGHMTEEEYDMTTQASSPDARKSVQPPFVKHEDEGTARWWMGSLALIKATSRDTDGRFALVEVRENEGETPLHVHHNEDETFWVIEGEIDFEVGGEKISARPGTMLFGPRSVPHRYTVRRGPARMLFLFTPGGFEDLLMETSDPAAETRIPVGDEGMPDFEKLPEIAKRFGCELLE